MERHTAEEWIESYEHAWRSPGTSGLARLFAEDATYATAPVVAPERGLDAITAMWERRRAGPDEAFAMRASVVAVDGDTVVARVEVEYVDEQPWVDLWVMEFGADGRCRAFEEWPFTAGRDLGD